MTLRGKMQAVMTELNGEIAERDELIYAIALALLSESNLFILGDPGQAKSFAVNEFRKRITGAKQFERLLRRSCGPCGPRPSKRGIRERPCIR